MSNWFDNILRFTDSSEPIDTFLKNSFARDEAGTMVFDRSLIVPNANNVIDIHRPHEGAAEEIKITGEDKDQSGFIAKRGSDKPKAIDATSGAKAVRKPLAVKINEAARLISVSPATIRRLAERGELRVIRKLRHALIPVSEVEAFVLGNISQEGGR